MSDNTPALDEIERSLGIVFTDRNNLLEALTHTSYTNETTNAGMDNERLEFLGDAVLGLIIGDHLFRTFPDRPEGALAKMKSVLVSDKTLADIAAGLSLGKYLRLGVGEERTGGRERLATLENTLEALIGALYLDGGFPNAQAFVLRIFREKFSALGGKGLTVDFKTELQERVQQKQKVTPVYTVTSTIGPEHRKQFSVEVAIQGTVFGRGAGSNKKNAEQDAARDALSHVHE
ncbi:MAG: ribonuclease III [Spirochaetota bacterium]